MDWIEVIITAIPEWITDSVEVIITATPGGGPTIMFMAGFAFMFMTFGLMAKHKKEQDVKNGG